MKSKKISKIELVFENCPYVTLYPDMIDFMEISEINYTMQLFGKYGQNEGLRRTKNCERFYMRINEKGLKQDLYLTKTIKDEDNWNLAEQLANIDNITSIRIYYKNDNSKDTYEDIYVLWSEDGEFENSYQKVEFKKDYHNKEYAEISIEES